MEEYLQKYFEDLDKDFVNISSIEDEEFLFNGQGVAIQSAYEVPLPVIAPGSQVKFYFRTEGGNVSFGVLFLIAPADSATPDVHINSKGDNEERSSNEKTREVEDKNEKEKDKGDKEEEEPEARLVLAMTMCDSHLEACSGSFQTPPYLGTLYFVWDNSHAWVTKQLTYKISMVHSSFEAFDKDRCSKAMDSLQRAQKKNKRAHRKLKHLMAYLQEEIDPRVQALEAEYEYLQRELQFHNEQLRLASRQTTHYEKQLTESNRIERGLFIRSLTHGLLRYILSFLCPTRSQGCNRYNNKNGHGFNQSNQNQLSYRVHSREQYNESLYIRLVCRRWLFVVDTELPVLRYVDINYMFVLLMYDECHGIE